MKRCRLCHVIKPLEEFHKASGTRDGRRGECKECFRAQAKARYPQVREKSIERARQWREENIERFRENQRRRRERPEVKLKDREGHLLRKYGITLAEYDRMLEEQDSGCAICGRAARTGSSLHVDHDHETGFIRGLLCFNCNNAIGDFGEDASLLGRASDYLRRYDVTVGPDVRAEEALVRRRARALIAG